MTQDERWARIEGIDGLYEVSTLGQIRNASGLVMKTRKDRYGYRRIIFRVNGKQVLRTCSSVVAAAFHGHRPPGFHVAHLDGSRDNDVPDNLAYVSPQENMAHKRTHGTSQHGERHGLHKLTVEQAALIKRSSETGPALGERYGVNKTTIRRIKNGEMWSGAIAAFEAENGRPS